MFRRRFADGDKGPIRSPFDPVDAPYGMTLERAVDVRIAPLVVLENNRSLDSLQIDLQHEVGSGIVPVIPVPHLDHEFVTIGAVDESFTGEPIRQIASRLFLSQPDVLGNEMERHRRSLLAVAVDRCTNFFTNPQLLRQTARIAVRRTG